MASPVEVTDSTFEAEVLQSDVPVLVDYWAAWCQPCRKMAPILDEVAQELDGSLKVAKLDVDANPNVSMSQGVTSLPTLSIYKNGEVVASIVGARPKPALMEEVQKHL